MVPREIVERVGSVNYNVLIFHGRRNTLIRSHSNQIKTRYSSNDENVDSTCDKEHRNIQISPEVTITPRPARNRKSPVWMQDYQRFKKEEIL